MTFDELKQVIINDLNRDDLTDVVADYVEDAIRHWQRTFFFKTDVVESLDTVPGQVFYDIPDTMMGITYMRLDLSGVWQWMSKVEYRSLLGLDNLVNPVRSVPNLWAPFDNKFRIFTAPDQIYQLELTGNGKIAIPTTGDSTNFWTEDGAPLIRRTTLAEIYRRRVKDFEKAAECDRDAQSYLMQLRKETINKSTMRQFSPWW